MLARLALALCCVLSTTSGEIVAQDSSVLPKVGSSGDSSKAQAAEFNRRGENSVQGRQFEEAKGLFSQAIHLNPYFSDAYENLALLSLLEGDDANAESRALQLLTLSPGNYNGRFVAGVAAINQNRFSRGRDYLGPLVEHSATDPLVTAAYAVALDKTGNHTEASRLNATLAETALESRDALLAGQIFREPRLKLKAEKWLEAGVKGEASPNPEMLYMLAGMYADQGSKADAVAMYRRVLDTSPGNVNALVELSELERTLGELEKSVSYLYAAKTLAATDTLSLLHLSQACMRRHMYVDARDALQKVVAHDPHNREAWYQLGLAQYKLGEADAAANDFTTALSLDAADEWSRVGLAAVLAGTGRQKQAAAEFARVLERDPRCGAAYYYLAQIHRESRQPVLALHELEKAVTYAKQDSRPLAALGQLQLALHDLPSARRSLQKAIELDPSSAIAHYSMAMLLRRTGEIEEAQNELERYKKYHDEESKNGIVGLVRKGEWDYPGFLPSN